MATEYVGTITNVDSNGEEQILYPIVKAEGIIGGKVKTGALQANTAAQRKLATSQLRNISAGTTDLVSGVSELATGQIYLVYEAI